MSQTRLTDLAVLSIERELADGLNFEILIVLLITLPKEKREKFVCKFSTDLMPCGSSLSQTVYVYNYCNKMKV